MALSDDGNRDGPIEMPNAPRERWAGVAWVIWGVLCAILVIALLLNWI